MPRLQGPWHRVHLVLAVGPPVRRVPAAELRSHEDSSAPGGRRLRRRPELHDARPPGRLTLEE
eukprot:2895115-Alexandrium_andersonii.AAC.1